MVRPHDSPLLRPVARAQCESRGHPQRVRYTPGMKLPITMYRDDEGWIVVECPAIPGCASQGRTEEEAMNNIRDAISLCLEARREAGLPLTIEIREVEVPAIA